METLSRTQLEAESFAHDRELARTRTDRRRYGNRSVAYLFARQQLYEFVWADPIITQAKKSLRVSDVELAKACRRGGIPLPPRGYAVALVLAGERRYPKGRQFFYQME